MKKTSEKNYAKSTNKLLKGVIISGAVLLTLGAVGSITAGILAARRESALNKVYSVSFGDSVKGKRADDAVGMVAGINGEKNNFDKAFPWRDIKSVKDEAGNEFVQIPKFYQRIDVNENGAKLSVAARMHKGFEVAPAFIQGDKELDYIQIGKYEAAVDSKTGSLLSKPGLMPETTGHTLDQYREMAEKDGNQLFDWRANQALQLLFAVEFATLDSQSIMAGETQYVSYVHELTAAEIAEGTIKTFEVTQDEACLIDSETKIEEFIKVNNDKKHVEVSMSHEAADENDEAFDVTLSELSLASYKIESSDLAEVTLQKPLDISKMAEDETISVNFGSYSYHKTGASVGRKGSSNGASQKSLEVTAMNYRGVENWYGNTYTWCDGLATYQDDQDSKFLCVSFDALQNGNRESYDRIDVTELESVQGLFKKGLFFLHFDYTDEIDYAYDNYYISFASEAYRIGFVGGGCSYGADAGAFYLGVDNTVSHASDSVRLSCIPQAR